MFKPLISVLEPFSATRWLTRTRRGSTPPERTGARARAAQRGYYWCRTCPTGGDRGGPPGMTWGMRGKGGWGKQGDMLKVPLVGKRNDDEIYKDLRRLRR